MSARAAARLSSLGYEQVFRYSGGKADWMANGWPIESQYVDQMRAKDLALPDVPTCQVDEHLGEVQHRMQSSGWQYCVVVDENSVVLGWLRSDASEKDSRARVDQVMECGPRTYRLNAGLEKTAEYMRRNNQEAVLVTKSDGRLLGLLKLEDVEKELLREQAEISANK
jgi:Mg/Co/Ni transporter MgtE